MKHRRSFSGNPSQELSAEHRVITMSGVIGQDAPLPLDAGSAPVGQVNAAHTRLTV